MVLMQTLWTSTLFRRVLFIIVIPIIVLQSVTVYIFYFRHWKSVTQYLQSSLIAEMKWLINGVESADSHPENMLRYAKNTFDIDAKLLKSYNNSTNNTDSDLKNFKIILEQNIARKVFAAYYSDSGHLISIIIGLHANSLPHTVLQVDFNYKRIESPTTYIFVLWVVGTALILLIVTLIFAKNQLRSILSLTDAAKRLSKGDRINNFIPSGAREIREAGLAFIEMKNSLEQQVKEKSELLTHIAHDMRTPLTRMKLQLALPVLDHKAMDMLNSNINEMDRLLLSYLNFARNNSNEKFRYINVKHIIQKIIQEFDYNEAVLNTIKIKLICSNINYTLHAKVMGNSEDHPYSLYARIYTLKGAITNILDNAIKFARNTVLISLKSYNDKIIVIISDNGPGIPSSMHKQVFNAFERNITNTINTGGFGLGLTIAKQAILIHQGSIKLGKSKQLGGLKIIIKLPRHQFT